MGALPWVGRARTLDLSADPCLMLPQLLHFGGSGSGEVAPVVQPHPCPWGWVICLAEYTFCSGVWVQQGEGGTWKQWVRRGEKSRGRSGCFSAWALDTPAGLHRVHTAWPGANSRGCRVTVHFLCLVAFTPACMALPGFFWSLNIW